MTRNNHCDVLIAGAGPAGLAAAIALRRRGADVLVADALRPPIDKPCGEGLMPDALRALAQLGIVLDAHHGASFAGVLFASGATRVAAGFTGGSGLGVRRPVLHQVLFDHAASLGVRFAWGVPVVLHEGQPPTLAGQACIYRWLIGADGSASRVRAWSGFDANRAGSRRFGYRAHFRLAPGSTPVTHVEVHWSGLGQVYITPVGPQEICVAGVSRHSGVRLGGIIASIGSLRDSLANATPVTQERGALTLTRRLRRVTRGNVALVGDASGSVDAITGEGLALAFRQSLLLAESLHAGGLALYASRHAATLALPRRMAKLMLVFDRHPRLRSRILQAFAARPMLFRDLLAVHLGEQSLRGFALHHGAQLGALLLAAQSASLSPPRFGEDPGMPLPGSSLERETDAA